MERIAFICVMGIFAWFILLLIVYIALLNFIFFGEAIILMDFNSFNEIYWEFPLILTIFIIYSIYSFKILKEEESK